MSWYTSIVSRHPIVVMVGVAVFSISCLVIALTSAKLPNFNDPQLGFESRGTVISNRLIAWQNLIEATRPSGPLTVNPYGDRPPSHHIQKSLSKDKNSKSVDVGNKVLSTANPNELAGERLVFNSQQNISLIIDHSHHNHHNNSHTKLEDDQWTCLKKLNFGVEHSNHEDSSDEHFTHDHNHMSPDGYFCGSPTPDYSRIVISGKGGIDLMTLKSLKEICRLEMNLAQGPLYADICQTGRENECCLPWSLPNYVAMLFNRSSCLTITETDVIGTKELLENCFSFYYNLQLMPDYEILQVPQQCRDNNAVYNIMHYLVDSEFLPSSANTSGPLRNTVIFLSIARSSAILDFYQSLKESQLNSDTLYVSAIDFGLKSTLFDLYLLQDTWLVALGALFVLLCMWMYTTSLFITIMTIVAIAFSLIISYFIYTLIFEMHFFPFMNLLALIVAVGIGADDAFILTKVWQSTKAENSSLTLSRLVQNTLKHSVLSMFVTTLTTTAAFFSSYISAIIAIRCFSIFAGTTVMVNFALMVTWLPASVVVSERVCWAPIPSLYPRLRGSHLALVYLSSALNNFLISSVVRFKYFWIFFLGSIAIASIAVVFYYPKLQLPDSPDFQLFASSHPFEQYDIVYRDKFNFEHMQKVDERLNTNIQMPLRFVWGVKPIDTGDHLDPFSRGALKLDPKFDIAAPESQRWLANFCHKLRAQPFYQSTSGPLLPNCFLEGFEDWINRRCINPIDHTSRAPCCDTSTFPYKREVFNTCLPKAIESLYRTPRELFIPGVAGPKFAKSSSKRPPKVKALVVEYNSNLSLTTSYVEINHFFHQVESWTEQELATAPPGMRNGFFISYFAFYDLQRTLAQDTVMAIIVSMVVSLIVLLLVTLNLLVSLYAIITISCIIFVTVGILVLIGWKLNVLESVAVSVAIGLAVDFSLHYSVNYRMCPDNENRESSVMYALSMMSGPTLMAAITTGAAGALMLPSSVMAYIQIGIFLVVVMFVSWVYSTYFLMALLCVAGPERNFGQLSYPKLRGLLQKSNSEDGPNSDKTVYINVLSESTLSTSSTMCALHTIGNETHELDALTRQPCRHSKRLKRSGSLSQPCHSNRSARKVSLPADQSPSAASATTIIHDDDYDNHIT
uniref:SSD domain-containing protein n=1 Tax=Clastoptera arizonana TaxID=38151 RepID=A0A1B6DLC4_9HEMI